MDKSVQSLQQSIQIMSLVNQTEKKNGKKSFDQSIICFLQWLTGNNKKLGNNIKTMGLTALGD